jgi:hypothetical protein
MEADMSRIGDLARGAVKGDPEARALLSRRSVLGAGMGVGAAAAAGLVLGPRALGAGVAPKAVQGPDLGFMQSPQIPARARRVISIHMWGAVSQVDTFDYKPTLIQRHGQDIPPSVKGSAKVSAMSNNQASYPLFAPQWPYKQYGQSGTWASELVRHIGAIGDDLTFIHTMNTPHVNHDPAAIWIHTGFQLAGRPSAGAWVHYALGADNANLPSFVVLKSQGTQAGVSANAAAWSAGFLPSHHQGVEFRAGAEPVLYVDNPAGLDTADRRAELDAIDALSRHQYVQTGDPEILSKLTQYEMAGRMQASVPEIADISEEPESVLAMYGPDVRKPGTFARNCLLTRRLIERDVKFVELIHVGWDHHNNLVQRHPIDCLAIDQPSAALVMDLKQRGLLDDTLVVWGAEFGRTSYAQGVIDSYVGRDHHGGNFTYWLAGGGTKPGVHYGESDDFSYNIAKDPVSIHDLHATMLYLMGIDHKQLTFHYQGRDFRLTDVEGEVVQGILA